MSGTNVIPLLIAIFSIILPAGALISRSLDLFAWSKEFAGHLMQTQSITRSVYGWIWAISASHLILMWQTHSRAYLVALSTALLVERVFPSVATILLFFVLYTSCVYIQEIHIIDAKIANSTWLKQDQFFYHQIDSFLRVSSQRQALTFTWVYGITLWFAKILWIIWLSSFEESSPERAIVSLTRYPGSFLASEWFLLFLPAGPLA